MDSAECVLVFLHHVMQHFLPCVGSEPTAARCTEDNLLASVGCVPVASVHAGGSWYVAPSMSRVFVRRRFATVGDDDSATAAKQRGGDSRGESVNTV